MQVSISSSVYQGHQALVSVELDFNQVFIIETLLQIQNCFLFTFFRTTVFKNKLKVPYIRINVVLQCSLKWGFLNVQLIEPFFVLIEDTFDSFPGRFALDLCYLILPRLD
jgi:hypothetical protein